MRELSLLFFFLCGSFLCARAAHKLPHPKDTEEKSRSSSDEASEICRLFAFLCQDEDSLSRERHHPQTSPAPYRRRTISDCRPPLLSNWQKQSLARADSAGGTTTGESASLVVRPGSNLSRLARSPEEDNGSRMRRSSTVTTKNASVLEGPRRTSLFPQCSLKTWISHASPQSTGGCHANRAIAAPPTRHPLVSVEFQHATSLPFSASMPPWNALVSQARNEPYADGEFRLSRNVHLWTLEISHNYLWIQTTALESRLQEWCPSQRCIQGTTFALLNLAEALMYAEGVRDLQLAPRYMELEEALNFAREVLDMGLQTLEDVLGPESQEGALQHGVCERVAPEFVSASAASSGDSDGTVSSAGATGGKDEEERLRAEHSPKLVSMITNLATRHGIGCGKSTTAASSTGGDTRKHRRQSLKLRMSLKFRSSKESESPKSRAESGDEGKERETLPETVEGRHVTVFRKALRRQREAGSAAADAAKSSKYLLAPTRLHTLRMEWHRLLAAFESRQLPLAVQRSDSQQVDPVRLFRVNLTEAREPIIPSRSGNGTRQRMIDVLSDLSTSIASVSIQNVAHPSSLCHYLLLLTGLSKNLRRVLDLKGLFPSSWKEEVTELLTHAYIRLDFLLSQRTAFLSDLPYADRS